MFTQNICFLIFLGRDILMEYYPRQAVWEMTLKCNMNCMHCGSKAGAKQKYELSFDKCIDIANQLIAMNLKMITLIGGEIFSKKAGKKLPKCL